MSMRVYNINMQLKSPNTRYEESYLQAVIESDEENLDTTLAKPQAGQSFADFVKTLLSQSKGDHLPKGYVPASTFWLIDKNEFIGRVQIRHTLTKSLLEEGGHIGYYIRPTQRKKGYGRKILELGLIKAKELGIYKALVTCDVDNFGSKKIIESQGGKFENTYVPTDGKTPKLRYWINTK